MKFEFDLTGNVEHQLWIQPVDIPDTGQSRSAPHCKQAGQRIP
jgi:hypothetical protein